jgi:hypothetical protein
MSGGCARSDSGVEEQMLTQQMELITDVDSEVFTVGVTIAKNNMYLLKRLTIKIRLQRGWSIA